jgi:hypothetical protein
MDWPEVGLVTELKVVERNLESESADELLAGIESGRWARCMLPWVPLMAGADNPTLVDRWKKLAEAEPNTQRRAEFGGIAILFAGRVSRKELWQEKLKGWNVEESTVVQEWVAMGRAEGRAEASRTLILNLGMKRFGAAPTHIEQGLLAITDDRRLERIGNRVMDATDWNDLLATP